MRLLLLCALLLLPSVAWAMSTGIYDLLLPANPRDTELTGFFSYDSRLESTNPFVEWSFTYQYPVAIVGQDWETQDGGYFVGGGSQSLLVTNPDNSTLTFQLCTVICPDTPTLWNMNVYDNEALRRYSANGAFALREVESFAAVQATTLTVPEPNTLWLVGLGVMGVMGFAAAGRYTSAGKP